MSRKGMASALLAALLIGVPLDAAVAAAPAEASVLDQWWDRDDDRGRGWRDRDWDRDRGGWWQREGRRDRGDWGGWHRTWHDDWGDCFRTPWGLACETGRPGVYRVRDRHRGDEHGPDCDVLITEDWGWRCYDSPRR